MKGSLSRINRDKRTTGVLDYFSMSFTKLYEPKRMMIRKVCLSLLGLGLAFLVRAQKPEETAIAKIHYLFKHVNDTTARGKFLQDEFVTYIGKTRSYFVSYSGPRLREEFNRQVDRPGFNGKVVFQIKSTPQQDSYLLNNDVRTMLEITKIAKDVLYIETVYPELEWTILDETKTIGGYACQKAQTHFKGRVYEAWFTTELPFSYGPWKLHGLPGLILAAADTKNEVVFAYAGFDKLTTENSLIAIPEGGIKATPAEVLKLKTAYKSNPLAFLKALSGGSGLQASHVNSEGGALHIVGSSGGTKVDLTKMKTFSVVPDNNYKPSINTNNPIELTP